jgi:GNAT superfamily N-acetyltransferase
MGQATPTVGRAVASDRETAADTLASAFSHDPVMSWMAGTDGDAGPRLRHLFSHSLGAALRRGDHLVDVCDGGQAAALWHEVDEWKPGTLATIKTIPAALRTFGRHLPRAARATSMIERVHPEEPHRYLELIGVHPSQRGRGLGGALLASMTDELDERGIAAYLESSNPLNEPLYARHGFVSRGLIELPQGAPALMAMWRDPR